MIESINFELSEIRTWHDQAMESALNDARQKAENLAGLAGAQLGAVWTISETGRSPGPVASVPERADIAEVPIEPATLTVEVQVEVNWLLESP